VDFLNRAIAQISELFRGLSPAARITTALLLVTIVVSIALLFNHQFSDGDRYLFGGEPVAFTEINGMTAAFGKAGLKDFELEGNRIRVPRGKYADYMAALADAGMLPRNFLDPIKKSLEGNILVDRKTREEKIKVATQEQLAEIISRMKGIEWATVMYNVENLSSLDAKKIVTASVTVKPIGSQALTDDQVQKIRLAVGPSIGAAPESVSVIDDNGNPYPGAAPGEVGANKNDYLATKQKFEQQYTQQIRQAISFVPGAIVVVNVDLNSAVDNSIPAATPVDPKLIPPAGQTDSAPIRSNTSLPDSHSSQLAQQGLPNMPAVIANLVGGHAHTMPPGADRTARDISEGSQSQVRRPIPLTLKRVTASIGIPASYYEDVWRRQQPGLSLKEIERQEQAKIEKYVLLQLPVLEQAADDASRLVVKTFQPVSTSAAETPTPEARALAWCGEHAGPIGMGFLGLVSLLMVRSIARGPTRDSASDSQANLTITREDSDGQWSAPNSATLQANRSTRQPSLRDELVDMVRDDPDAAANVLRRWISAAS
jgi:flagellar M-ring protein FliF